MDCERHGNRLGPTNPDLIRSYIQIMFIMSSKTDLIIRVVTLMTAGASHDRNVSLDIIDGF